MAQYNHKIEYRIKEGTGVKGWEDFEITLDYKLRTGDRDYEQKVKNLIQSRTGDSASNVYQCKIKFLGEIEDNNTTTNHQSNKGDTILSRGASSIGKGLDKMGEANRAQNEREKKEKEADIADKIAHIQSIQFSNDENEIRTQIEDLVSFASGISAEKLPAKKTAYNKALSGLAKLKRMNASDLGYLEQQINKLKPKWYQKIWHWMDSNN